MKLRTVGMLSATGVVATAITVWTAVGPARGSSAPPGGPTKVVVDPPPALSDRSQFVAGKTLMIEGRLGHQVLPADADSETFLFVDVSAAAAAARTPAPLDLAIAIDRSGSMKGKRMTNAIAAARTAIERLRDGDVVSLVTFNTEVQVPIAPTVISPASRVRLLRDLDKPITTGDTCISCGIDKAMQLIGKRDGMVNRILLLSDGAATAGVRDLAGFRRIAEDCRRMGASLTTIGVDVDFDERIMSALARSSNGRHFFVAEPEGLPAIFDQEMQSLTRTVANKAELTIDLAPGVFVEHVYDRVTVGSGSQIVVPLGAFAAGERKTVLARVRVPRGGAGERPVAAVRLRYDDLAESVPGACEGELATQLSTDPSALSTLDAIVSARVSASETAEALEAANELARAGRTVEARDVIVRGQERVEKWRKRAAVTAPELRAGEVDAVFGKQQATLDSASSAFQPEPTPAVATTPGSWSPADEQARAKKKHDVQIKQSQSDALELSE
jgi:Ca-activated chloride channel homolog